MHTLETLLQLLDSPEGIEKLRILAAEADGWRRYGKLGQYLLMCHPHTGSAIIPPDYPTSLDAIFAAEERLGCHDFNKAHLRYFWIGQLADALISSLDLPDRMDVTAACLSASPALHCIAFILTAQYKKEKGL